MHLLPIIVWAVAGSPALWTRDDRPTPTVAVFDMWVETPGTGWYDMCQSAGAPGYDGVNPAIALELDSCDTVDLPPFVTLNERK